MTKRSVVIAGGSSGIGEALVKLLANQAETRVISLDKDIPKTSLDNVTYIQVDLTDEQQTQDAIAKLPNPVNVVIVSIGVMRRGTIFDTTESDYDLLLNTNLKAPWHLIKYVRPLLATESCIVQISSGHAIDPQADPGIYTLTKKATSALAELISLTLEDVRVKVVYPGPVLTPLLLAGRTDADRDRISKIAAKPEDIAIKINDLIDSANSSLIYNYNSDTYVTE